jgi:hypothetical protein
MPLVGELTAEFKAYMTPEKFRSLNAGWRLQGGGYPDAVVDDTAAILSRMDMHYEALLGYFETQYTRNRQYVQDYHSLYARFIEIVYYLLMKRHSLNVNRIGEYVRFFEGIAGLVKENAPLWVFSLNHDLIVECVALAYSVPLSCGFPDRSTLPRRNAIGVKIGTLDIEMINGEQFEQSGLVFFPRITSGINLLKIHGGLGMFTFREGKDLARILPITSSPAGIINAVDLVDEDVTYPVPLGVQKLRAINEITYADDEGKMQFLRRSLLSGAYKFDGRHQQVLPGRYLEFFKEYINHVIRLICIGYGFGDLHINAVMRNWLELMPERQLVVVSPTLDSIPNFLLHLAPQVEIVSENATDYLQCFAFTPLTENEVLFKKFCSSNRRAAWKSEIVIPSQ